jgi:prevent-host-death family protein
MPIQPFNFNFRLSVLLDTVIEQGAQTITRHGKPVAVVISAETYARLQPRETLADILRECPVKGWTLDRDEETARDLSFE